MDIQLHQWLVAHPAEAVDLAGLHHQDVTRSRFVASPFTVHHARPVWTEATLSHGDGVAPGPSRARRSPGMRIRNIPAIRAHEDSREWEVAWEKPSSASGRRSQRQAYLVHTR